MAEEYQDRQFQAGTIINDTTVEGVVDGRRVEIEILYGGLPKNTLHVTVRKNELPEGLIVVGAFVRNKDLPLTMVGRIRSNESFERK
jgi:hypothetical protein